MDDDRTSPSLLDLSVAELLDSVARRTAAPGGGAAAALTTALAAALTAMAARFAGPGAAGAAGAAARADELRAVAAALADADVAAYRAFRTAARTPREDDPWMWPSRLREALDDTVDVPLDVATVAREITRLAAGLAREGNPRLRGDAATGALLAAAAASSAALLVTENLTGEPDDVRTGRALGLAAAARRTAQGLLPRTPGEIRPGAF
ncbi:cyclodeaminase/cyclohydrolase family protein [Pseudonocardia bannensis]|uniref:Formiminotransferase-cyclodeaminase n=1 Tax=Pseudonocardia bannensis TaxID=630973 RepID=A0A848DRE2_9PSEU|nr:cyclodeaminase/cyclohydrolase family protein [Pseudonocardia bannensis]NMH95308.1 formiminotransferase-cyclodeaminase [Pseudonocardia bannensis]